MIFSRRFPQTDNNLEVGDIPLSTVKEKIRTFDREDAEKYLELASNTECKNQHENHQLDLIKALLETQISKKENEQLIYSFDEANPQLFQFQGSIVTNRTRNICSLAGFSQRSLSIREFEGLLVKFTEDQNPPTARTVRYLTTEQDETIKQIEEQMSYGQLFNNIQDLLFSEPESQSYIDLSGSLPDIEEQQPRKSVRSKVYFNFINNLKGLFKNLKERNNL